MELRLERLASEMEFATVVRLAEGRGRSVAAGEAIAEVEAEKVIAGADVARRRGAGGDRRASSGDELAVGALHRGHRGR